MKPSPILVTSGSRPHNLVPGDTLMIHLDVSPDSRPCVTRVVKVVGPYAVSVLPWPWYERLAGWLLDKVANGLFALADKVGTWTETPVPKAAVVPVSVEVVS